MTLPLDEWSEDEKRSAVQAAWTEPPGTEMTAWLDRSYAVEPLPTPWPGFTPRCDYSCRRGCNH
jgi:hypothetical protein